MMYVELKGFMHFHTYTSNTQYQKFEINNPRKGIARPQSQSPHSCACERVIHSHDRSAYPAAEKYVDESWEYVSIAQRHMNVEIGTRGRRQFIFWEHINKIFVAAYTLHAVTPELHLQSDTLPPQHPPPHSQLPSVVTHTHLNTGTLLYQPLSS
jgi:hypothetical protein